MTKDWHCKPWKCKFCGALNEGGRCENCDKMKDEDVARVDGMPLGVK